VTLWTTLKAALNIAIKAIIVARTIRRWECDLVYSNTVTTCLGAFVALVLRRPHVWHLHEFGFEDQGLSFIFGEGLSLFLVNRLSTCCICVSRALAKKYEKTVDAVKIAVIYPSMHRAAKEASEPFEANRIHKNGDRFCCVIVGALIPGKGQEDAVRAFALLKLDGINAELVIVGDSPGSYGDYLRDIVHSSDLARHVSFLGHVSNAMPLMRRSDAVLVCSRAEAFGRVTVEGMLIGKPVIGARSAATAELIQDGISGLLYSPGDPKDLAKKITYLCRNPAVAKQEADHARSWSQELFTIQRYSAQLMPLLSSVCPIGQSKVI